MEVPLFWRVFLFVSKELLSQQMRRMYDDLIAEGAMPGMTVFEGLFHLGKATVNITREDEDVATFGFHFAPLDEGVIRDAPPSGAQMDLVTARVTTLCNSLKGFYFPSEKFDRVIYHDAGPLVTDELGHLRGVTYDTGGHRVPGQPPANPAIREDVLGITGTCATESMMSPQTAVSVTFKTKARRQWGRVYLPFQDLGNINPTVDPAAGAGQLGTATVDNIRTYWGTFADGLAADGCPLVVWSTKHQHALSVDQIQVDSLFDVIRSRRYDKAFHKATHTVG